MSFFAAAVVRNGKTAVAKDIPNRLTAKLWMFLAKWNAASPPSSICIPIFAKIRRFICHAIRLIDLGSMSFKIFLNPGCFTFNDGLNLYSVVIASATRMIVCRVAPINTPVAAE